MTSITLTVVGAKAQATVNGPLTSGMVGIPVTIEYDDAWNGLTKNLVCRCGKWGPDRGETRTILSVGETATVAHEVMKTDTHLYLGIEGYSTDGKLVIPTTWADCGKIQCGANADADPSTNQKLSVWSQLQAEIKRIEQQALTKEQIGAIVAAYLDENASVQNAALTTAQINALDGMFKVCAFTKADVSAEYSAFKTAFDINDSGDSGEDSGDDNSGETEVTLTGISVTYDGGDAAAGTAVADLTGIVVTAHYSDGSAATVTGYTLSGEIAEGENTVTVTYQGKTTTFTVTGTPESAGDEEENNGWTDGEAYAIEWTDGYGIDHSGTQGGGAIGAVFENTSRSVSNFMPCRGASALNVSGIYTNYGLFFYDENKEFVINQRPYDYTAPVPVPLTAYYVRVQCVTSNKASATVTPVMLDTLNESTVWESGVHYCLEWEYGKQLNSSTGAEATHTSTTRNVSDYALCMGVSTITTSHKLKTMVWFYDGDKNALSTVQFGASSNVVSVPEGAVYFRDDTCGYADNMNCWFMLS